MVVNSSTRCKEQISDSAASAGETGTCPPETTVGGSANFDSPPTTTTINTTRGEVESITFSGRSDRENEESFFTASRASDSSLRVSQESLEEQMVVDSSTLCKEQISDSAASAGETDTCFPETIVGGSANFDSPSDTAPNTMRGKVSPSTSSAVNDIERKLNIKRRNWEADISFEGVVPESFPRKRLEELNQEYTKNNPANLSSAGAVRGMPGSDNKIRLRYTVYSMVRDRDSSRDSAYGGGETERHRRAEFDVFPEMDGDFNLPGSKGEGARRMTDPQLDEIVKFSVFNEVQSEADPNEDFDIELSSISSSDSRILDDPFLSHRSRLEEHWDSEYSDEESIIADLRDIEERISKLENLIENAATKELKEGFEVDLEYTI